MSTKFDITTALVKTLVATQFPQWAHLPITPVTKSGWDNRTFHLGKNMSVRLPSALAYIDQVAKEQGWLPKLAPHLPLPIPTPLVMGQPTKSYPYPWSIYKWLEGENTTSERIANMPQFATSLAQFLTALQKVDPTDGPPPGPHNFFRGGSLTTYNTETRTAINTLQDQIDAQLVTEVWETALCETWSHAPVWVHGDVSAGNLLIKKGTLCAVIDFGCSAVGDPACDLVIAFTLFTEESREAFRSTLPADQAMWARARGWALWKSLIILAKQIDAPPHEQQNAQFILNEVLADHKRYSNEQ